MDSFTISVIIGKDGRITIPNLIRKEHDLKEGDVLRFTSNGQGHKIEIEVLYKETTKGE